MVKIKTIRNLFKQDKDKFVTPKGVQDVIPVDTIYKDGIFVRSKNKYSKCYRFTDINYAVASKNDKEAMFLQYSELLNSFDGLNTVLPYGIRKINALRTLTTESLAVFMPFRVQEINHVNGIFYGENVISKNMIIADRRELLNGNSFILGVSGSGKSFTAKNEIVSIALRDPNADIIIIDPEREYPKLVESLGGRRHSYFSNK